MNESFREYVLYEPILRILTARGYTVRFEVECPRIDQPDRGDRKRLDLVAKKEQSEFAIEVKWAKRPRLDTKHDVAKLTAYLEGNGGLRAFLCVFGRRSHIEHLDVELFQEQGRTVFADFGKTRYGCRIFELRT